jgi:hypothetical protein
VAAAAADTISEVRAADEVILLRAGKVEAGCDQLRVAQPPAIEELEAVYRIGSQHVVRIEILDTNSIPAIANADEKRTETKL